MKLAAAILVALLLAPPPSEAATRIKELVSVEGVRDNPLVGYGLVVGLSGTGDRRQTIFSAQTLTNMLQQMGVKVTSTTLQVQNTAAVMVTANLPPFARPGTRIDATVAAMGDASSLNGGLLVMTSLRAVDGKIYSIAQGPLVLGGYTAGVGGNTQTLNHPTTARIPNGAIIEQASPTVAPRDVLMLQLHHPDVTTSIRIAESINQRFNTAQEPVASAEDAGLVRVAVPADYSAKPVMFLGEIERLTVTPDHELKVVVNERTGTIVAGEDILISPTTVVHGSLTVEITTEYEVSQPAPFSSGTTQVVPKTTVRANEQRARNVTLKRGTTVDDLVRQLNAIGATSREVISILEGLRSAGALDAEIEVI
jgi:flagellar P-ring protein precursor FlgI